jgi:hypothetical protein
MVGKTGEVARVAADCMRRWSGFLPTAMDRRGEAWLRRWYWSRGIIFELISARLKNSQHVLCPNKIVGNSPQAPSDEVWIRAPAPGDTLDFVRGPRLIVTSPKTLLIFPNFLPLSLAASFLPPCYLAPTLLSSACFGVTISDMPRGRRRLRRGRRSHARLHWRTIQRRCWWRSGLPHCFVVMANRKMCRDAASWSRPRRKYASASTGRNSLKLGAGTRPHYLCQCNCGSNYTI